MKMGQRENAIMTRLQILGGGPVIIETTLLGIGWWDEIKQQPRK